MMWEDYEDDIIRAVLADAEDRAGRRYSLLKETEMMPSWEQFRADFFARIARVAGELGESK